MTGFCEYCGEIDEETFTAPWMGVDYCTDCFIAVCEERIAELEDKAQVVRELSMDVREKRYNKEQQK